MKSSIGNAKFYSVSPAHVSDRHLSSEATPFTLVNQLRFAVHIQGWIPFAALHSWNFFHTYLFPWPIQACFKLLDFTVPTLSFSIVGIHRSLDRCIKFF